MTGQSLMDGRSSIHRLGNPFTERPKMADMIEMIVSDQNSREGVHIHIILLKNLLQTTQADSCINQDSPSISPEIVAVSATAA
jgi:hypothetical protein